MSRYIKNSQWDKYREIINNFHEDAFRQEVTWERTLTNRDVHGEDRNIRRENIILEGLVQYNYFRSWPINKTEIAGEVDKENVLIYFNINYLKKMGYTDDKGNFLFNRGYDRFIIDGVEYKPFGDSHAAQAKGETLFIFIILKREDIDTGEEPYQQ